MTEPLPPAAAAASMLSIWVITDGKAGDEIPCLGVAEEVLGVRGGPFEEIVPGPMDALTRYAASFARRHYAGGSIDIRRVSPRAPWVWMMPAGPIDPADRPDRPGSILTPPWPDIVIASGRRSIPYVRAIKRLSLQRTFTVILKDPRTRNHGADFVWVPEHDRSTDPRFMRTLTTPHRFAEARILAARGALPAAIASLPCPRVAVLLGGRTRCGPFSPRDRDLLCRDLAKLAATVGSFLITVSRRTPPDLMQAVCRATSGRPCFVWDQEGPNPYLHVLAAADAIVVTGDSHNMISEADATGASVMIFQPDHVKAKLTYFAMRMFEEGWATPFTGSLVEEPPGRHDCTPLVATELRRRLAAAVAARGA